MFILLPVVVASVAVAFVVGGLLEARLLAGDYRGWLLSALGMTYDQRNSLVVGVAMGFAVVPIIFTIAEDSLANVPQHLRAGSAKLADRDKAAIGGTNRKEPSTLARASAEARREKQGHTRRRRVGFSG